MGTHRVVIRGPLTNRVRGAIPGGFVLIPG
jgi:hypothetical protein